MLAYLKNLLFPQKSPSELSRGQLALLSDFDIPRELKARGWREGWEAVLGVDAKLMLNRFIKAGLIVPAPYEAYVNYLNLPQLKTILKKINLPVSGKKSVLVERVLSSGYEIEKDYPQSELWICSELGLSYATPYIEAEKKRKADAISGAEEALNRNNLKEAARIAADYEAGDVFGKISLSGEILKKGVEVTVNQATPPDVRAKEILEGLKVFQDTKKRRPLPFKDVPAEIFDTAADAVTWSCLLLGKGKRIPEAERVALELWGWRTSKQRLAEYKKSETEGIILGVEILSGNECPVGAVHKGKIYSTTKVPELPLMGCTREPCCSCCYTPRVKDY